MLRCCLRGDDQQAELVERLRKREEGPEASQGRIVDPDQFTGMQSLIAAERAKKLADSTGLQAIIGSEIFCEVHKPRRRREGFEHVEELENAVYLPELARTPATTDLDELPERLQSYLQLIVDPDVADPAYLAGLLNTPIGHSIRTAASVGTTIGRITKDSLLRATMYLPPLPVQKQAADALRRISNTTRRGRSAGIDAMGTASRSGEDYGLV